VLWFNAHSDMFTFRAALRSLRNFPLSEYRDAAHSAGGLLRRLPIRRANCVARSKLADGTSAAKIARTKVHFQNLAFCRRWSPNCSKRARSVQADLEVSEPLREPIGPRR